MTRLLLVSFPGKWYEHQEDPNDDHADAENSWGMEKDRDQYAYRYE
ncbi:MAG: hypothetical protein ACQESD_01340 [Thermoplasmatota archaeon]